MRRFWRYCSRFLALLLCHLIALQPVSAQQGLRIQVVQGAKARNVVQSVSARPITVEVQDASGRPVPDATVTFVAPAQGPGGEFSNDLRTLTVTTDSAGRASAGQYHANT